MTPNMISRPKAESWVTPTIVSRPPRSIFWTRTPSISSAFAQETAPAPFAIPAVPANADARVETIGLQGLAYRDSITRSVPFASLCATMRRRPAIAARRIGRGSSTSAYLRSSDCVEGRAR